MQETANRKIIVVGGAIGITLPIRFLRKRGWKVGDTVTLVFNDQVAIVRLASKEEQNIRAGEDNEGLQRIRS